MAATFEFMEDTGAATGSPPRGTTQTGAIVDVNWKNSGVQTDVYSSFPITAGNNSFEKWQYGHFTVAFNQISAGLFAHTGAAFGTGLTLKGPPTVTSTGTALVYTTPSATTNAALTVDMTSVIAIGSGSTVWFTPTGPQAAVTTGAATCSTIPCYTTYLTTQLQTTGSAAAGDTATVTLTLQYNEN